MNNKRLPVIIVAIVVLLLGGIFAFIKSRGDNAPPGMVEEIAPEIPPELRPFTSLTPTEDGHFLTLLIDEVKIEGATVLDFELFYLTGSGNQQGSSGLMEIKPGETLEDKLLLGSESSGKFRYDDGVENGTLTIRFRNDDGKLLGKLTTDFSLLTNTNTLVSPDGSFIYELDKAPRGVFFVVMQTFGTNEEVNIEGTNYAIFSSDGETYPGSAI